MIWHTRFKSVRFFFLWWYLKSKVYSNHPQSIEQLKDAIRQEITAIPPRCWGDFTFYCQSDIYNQSDLLNKFGKKNSHSYISKCKLSWQP